MRSGPSLGTFNSRRRHRSGRRRGPSEVIGQPALCPSFLITASAPHCRLSRSCAPPASRIGWETELLAGPLPTQTANAVRRRQRRGRSGSPLGDWRPLGRSLRNGRWSEGARSALSSKSAPLFRSCCTLLLCLQQTCALTPMASSDRNSQARFRQVLLDLLRRAGWKTAVSRTLPGSACPSRPG